MRKAFRGELLAYNEKINRFEDLEELQDGRLSGDIEQLLKQTAIAEATPRQTQREIFDVQIEKQNIMRELQQEIASLDDETYIAKRKSGTRLITEQDGNFFIKRKEELHERVTLGDILTDADWGINYHLDESVPRNIRKRYLIEQAKFRLRNLLDKQIIANESTSSHTDFAKARAFADTGEQRGKNNEAHLGMVAEKMVRNFLAKLTWDNPDLEFDVAFVDIDRDMREKIDFIVHVRSHHRGVDVDVPDHATGIQFTINRSLKNIEHKKEQLKHAEHATEIDDVLLVSLPASEFATAYSQWEKYKTAGGPDRYWDPSTKEQIFRHVMKGVLEDEEIEDHWQKISASEAPESQNIAA